MGAKVKVIGEEVEECRANRGGKVGDRECRMILKCFRQHYLPRNYHTIASLVYFFNISTIAIQLCWRGSKGQAFRLYNKYSPYSQKLRQESRGEEGRGGVRSGGGGGVSGGEGRVKTNACNWHMKFKEVESLFTQYSQYPQCSSPYSFLFLPPRWKFTFPPQLWRNCLFIPLSFKEPLVAIPHRSLIPLERLGTAPERP